MFLVLGASVSRIIWDRADRGGMTGVADFANREANPWSRSELQAFCLNPFFAF
jgi:hypothetical protein